MENELRAREEVLRDRIRGCLLGGAAGDALGYPVEFQSAGQITARFGPEGIRDYVRDAAAGKALISDDTQMTLFTANGILVGETRGALRGTRGDTAGYAALAYQDWLRTQNLSWEQGREPGDGPRKTGGSWLLDVPELYALRAPGNTCLSAIAAYSRGDGRRYGTTERPINASKGCGGIMRVAPLAMAYRAGENYRGDQAALDREGAELAAVTHGHPLGWMPAAALTHILSRCLTAPEQGLRAIVREARDAMAALYPGNEHLGTLLGIMDRAMALADRGGGDRENIRALGEGWVAEETLGIAIYCSLRYENDFSGGIIAAVNHDGDSDSTGAAAGGRSTAAAGTPPGRGNTSRPAAHRRKRRKGTGKNDQDTFYLSRQYLPEPYGGVCHEGLRPAGGEGGALRHRLRGRHPGGDREPGLSPGAAQAGGARHLLRGARRPAPDPAGLRGL